MRTHNRLYEQIYDWDALLAAWKRVRKGRREQPAVLEFERNLETELIVLQNELVWECYRTGPYREFEIYEPKRRRIAALPLRDRVLHHALHAVLEPIFERGFYFHSYACRPGKGAHRCADAAQAMLRRVKRDHGRVYALKADVASYFHSIDHAALNALLARRIRCKRTLKLCAEIIGSSGGQVGIPIGNLSSQLFAGIYLDALDRHVKHDLKCRHYIRYQDDFAILSPDKHELHRLRRHIEGWLHEHLALQLNSKTAVFPVGGPRGRALDFVGYRIWPTHRKMRRSAIRRILRAMRRLQKAYAAGRITLDRVRSSIQSWNEHASHANAYGLRRSLLARLAFVRKGE